MAEFEVEQIIAQDILDQFGKAEVDEKSGFHEATMYRLRVVKVFCGNLLSRIAEREIEQGGDSK